MLWRLFRFPVSMRGPAAPTVWHDDAVVRQWNLDNLNPYWRQWLTARRNLLGRGMHLLTDEAIAWCVPGVARIYYTVTTGNVTSKSGGCRHALTVFPDRWHALVTDALTIRSGERSVGRNRLARRRDAIGFMELVIDAANATV